MVKLVDDEIYSHLVRWWNKRHWPSLPKKFLPETGYVAIINGVPVIAGFLYLAQTGHIAWLEWVISDPEIPYEDRQAGWVELLNQLESVAKSNEVMAVFTTSTHAGYVKKMEGFGYLPYEVGSTSMLKTLI